MKKIKICILNTSLYALGDLIMLSSNINNLKNAFLQKNIQVEFDFISRNSSKFLHKLVISLSSFYPIFNPKVNAFTIFVRLFNFLYLFLFGGYLNFKKYKYFLIISNNKRKTAKLIRQLYFNKIIHNFEDIYKIENLPLQNNQNNYQNFNFIEAKKFNKPTIGFFIGASSTSKSWYPQNWAELLLKMKNKFGDKISIHIYGSSILNGILYNMFKQECQKLNLKEGVDYISFVNKQDLIQDISHAKGLDIAITNDSGFMWVSAACKIHNIAILGFNNDTYYSRFDKQYFYPINANLVCSPCFENYVNCKNKSLQNNNEFYNCMGYNKNQIDNVFDKILIILNKLQKIQ